MINIDKKNWFKDVGTSLEERNKHVEKVINELPCHTEVASMALVAERSFEKDPYFASLDQLGTFILKSGDVDSCRSIEDSFYETERDYRSRYEIGKNSYSTDFTLPENDVKADSSKQEGISIEDYYRMFNISAMSENEVKRVIKYALPKRSDDISISGKLNELYELINEIVDGMSDVINKTIFDLLVSGSTESEISKVVNMSQAAVNKRISKMCKIIINY
ncbi:hypothetical protein ACWN8V_07190 [Vagococcus elongatus]|uniref:Uncharacterized protein n=1 Tax=Vagococcus elongatus TaxID=180344 RepID=A0A430AW86_9ENTE|nr:hypothetical protein [Vagococcus elongatus]RSU12317.1 hypothetical protein CBF29_06865 [Vagococcus elongatus]